MKITKTRLREIIAEEMSSTAYDRDDGDETKTIDSLPSWIDDYVDPDKNRDWIDLAVKMLSKGRWNKETFKKLVRLKHDLRLGNKLAPEDQDLLDFSNPDQSADPFPMTERRLAELIRETIADFKK